MPWTKHYYLVEYEDTVKRRVVVECAFESWARDDVTEAAPPGVSRFVTSVEELVDEETVRAMLAKKED